MGSLASPGGPLEQSQSPGSQITQDNRRASVPERAKEAQRCSDFRTRNRPHGFDMQRPNRHGSYLDAGRSLRISSRSRYADPAGLLRQPLRSGERRLPDYILREGQHPLPCVTSTGEPRDKASGANHCASSCLPYGMCHGQREGRSNRHDAARWRVIFSLERRGDALNARGSSRRRNRA